MQHMHRLLSLLILLPVVRANLIHVSPKQLDEVLPIVEHALIHVYDNKPSAAVKNITTYSSIPIYAINTTHERFPKTYPLYVCIRNVVIPFKSQPEHYHMMVPRIATLYEPTYVINENEGVLVNGNSSMHENVLSFCYSIPEIQCFSSSFTDELIFEGESWDPTTDFRTFMRRIIMPYPVTDVDTESQEDYLLLVRLYLELMFVHKQNAGIKRRLQPLIEESEHAVGFIFTDDFSQFQHIFDSPEVSAVYVSMVNGTNKTYTGPLEIEDVRTFLTTCIETI